MNRTWTIILFLAPALILYGVFVLLSFGETAYFSLFHWDGETAMRFAGIGNFTHLLGDRTIIHAFLHNLLAAAMAVVIQVGIAMVVAVLLSRSLWGFKTFRAIFFLPVVVSAVAFALMWGMFLDPQFGLVDMFLRAIGLPKLSHAWLANPHTALVFGLLPQTTQGIGWQMVILLAAISGIPQALFESADLDGINFFQRVRYITVPLIWEATQICIVIAVLSALQGFTHIMVLTRGGPNNATNLVGLEMYRTIFVYSQFGYGSSIAVGIVAVGLVFSVVFKRYFSVRDLEY